AAIDDAERPKGRSDGTDARQDETQPRSSTHLQPPSVRRRAYAAWTLARVLVTHLRGSLVAHRHLAVPARAFGAGPVRGDVPAGHPTERDRIADREVDMTEHGHPDAEREPVVHERRSGAQVVGERVGPAQHQPGCEHDDDGAGEERGVELLPGVELAHLDAPRTNAVAAAEPAGIVARPAVDAAGVAPELRSPPSGGAEEDRDRKQDPGVHV